MAKNKKKITFPTATIPVEIEKILSAAVCQSFDMCMQSFNGLSNFNIKFVPTINYSIQE